MHFSWYLIVLFLLPYRYVDGMEPKTGNGSLWEPLYRLLTEGGQVVPPWFLNLREAKPGLDAYCLLHTAGDHRNYVQQLERKLPLQALGARRNCRVVGDHVRLEPARLHFVEERKRALNRFEHMYFMALSQFEIVDGSRVGKRSQRACTS